MKKNFQKNSFVLKKAIHLHNKIKYTMDNELITIQVSKTRESEKSIGALVDLKFDEKGNCFSSTTLVWFPKSICSQYEEDYERDWYGKTIICKKWFITAPKWFLDKNKIKQNIEL